MGKLISWTDEPTQTDAGEISMPANLLLYAHDVHRYRAFQQYAFSIKFSLQKRLYYHAGGKYHEVPAGSYLLVNEGQELECHPAENDIKALCINITPALIYDVLRNYSCQESDLLETPFDANNKDVGFFEHVYHTPNNEISELCTRLMFQMERNDTTRQDLPIDYFFNISKALIFSQAETLSQIRRIDAKNKTTREELYRRLLQARDFLHDTDDALSLSTIAQAAFLSPYHFHRSFKRVFRQTPMQYLRALRIEKAGKLLEQGGKSITDVALLTGFTDIYTFSKMFKKMKKCTPTEYKNKI